MHLLRQNFHEFIPAETASVHKCPTAWMKSGTHLKDPFVPMKADGAPAPTHLSDSPALPGH